jgi:hypothetical protein
MQPTASKPKGRGGLQLPTPDVMARLERSLVQNSPPNFTQPPAEPAPAPEVVAEPEQVTPEQDALTRVNPPKEKKPKVENLPVPTHGKRVRLSLYVTPEEADQIRKLAAEANRSESYMGAELLTQALKARSKR